MYRVFRFKKVPTYWPAASTVFVDYPTGDVEQYITDNDGTRTLVSSSGAVIPANIKAGLLAATSPSSTNRFVTYQEILGITGTNADWNATSGPSFILNKPTIPSIDNLATKVYVDSQDSLKVDKVTGKGLSTNDYTTAEQTKLSGIAAGAEVNVNADWNATSGDAQILNKPTIPVQAVPVGGTAGQILAKIDATDFNLEWIENYANYTSTIKHTIKAGEAINKGQAVYVSSANGTNMVVSKASNTTEATSSKTMGLLAQTLVTNGQGFVVTEGLLSGLNTNSANVGDPVWLGTNGDLIYGLLNKPYGPTHLVFIGIVTRVSSTVGEIFVKVQNGFELKEIHDVDLITTAPSNNEVLTYETSTGLWKNKTVVTALGFTPYNATNPNGYITSSALSTYVPYTGATGNVNIGANSYLGTKLTLGTPTLNVPSGFTVAIKTASIDGLYMEGTGLATRILMQAQTLSGGNGQIEIYANTNNNSFLRLGTSYLRESSGLLAIGGTNFAPTATLHVRGASATVGNAFLIQNSTPTAVFTVSNAGLATFNPAGASGDAIEITNGGYFKQANVRFRGSSNSLLFYDVSYNTFFTLSPTQSLSAVPFVQTGYTMPNYGVGFGNAYYSMTNTYTNILGGYLHGVEIKNTYNPSSSTGVFRDLYIAPVSLGAGVVDWRGIEVVGGSTSVSTLIKLKNGTTDLFVVKGDSTIGFFGVTPVVRQTLGAATAGMVYSTTEQAMLQNVYNLLRTFGLGT